MISGTIRVIVFPIMQTFRNFTISMLYDGQDNQPVSNLHNSNKLCRKTRRKTFYFAYNYPLFNKIIRDEGEMFQNSTSTPSSNVTRSSLERDGGKKNRSTSSTISIHDSSATKLARKRETSVYKRSQVACTRVQLRMVSLFLLLPLVGSDVEANDDKPRRNKDSNCR